ncbi:MAG: hypothetical protein H5T85_08965, partial [Actinobacteria bacterium]|nr:hypothetical protein [Actinomycetota bacterium]
TFKGEEDEVFLGKEIVSRPHYSDKVAAMIDEEVSEIIESCYNRARKILEENKETLVELANRLIEKETLDREEVMEILFKVKSEKDIRKDKERIRKERVEAKSGEARSKEETKVSSEENRRE